MKKKQRPVWIVGSLASHFLYGTFRTAHDAAKWAVKHMSSGSPWYIRRVTRP